MPSIQYTNECTNANHWQVYGIAYLKCLKAESVSLWSWVQSCLEIPHLYCSAGSGIRMRSTVEVGVVVTVTASLVPKAEDRLTIAGVNFHMSHGQQWHKQHIIAWKYSSWMNTMSSCHCWLVINTSHLFVKDWRALLSASQTMYVIIEWQKQFLELACAIPIIP